MYRLVVVVVVWCVESSRFKLRCGVLLCCGAQQEARVSIPRGHFLFRRCGCQNLDGHHTASLVAQGSCRSVNGSINQSISR